MACPALAPGYMLDTMVCYPNPNTDPTFGVAGLLKVCWIGIALGLTLATLVIACGWADTTSDCIFGKAPVTGLFGGVGSLNIGTLPNACKSWLGKCDLLRAGEYNILYP
jgi:hypothetical protein